ncbi:hypothetical protein SNOG_10616 [Parastagonospora nodorum SN15]|uniref:Uncharacterized protein n=1 Tax=Phaeosphaeria nodorum (strain SN15 / ATCC MYA-4574 / FGSC 10173) TaxID=321614 RepID=Q0UC98_PHANO|nr:hypothetical protein SNOG_10616 [Parastagonospora nodorum SN15]EAT82010.2 hypothetical protein SNOG_10616 [Parastagonospora nodorum SN15]
MHTSLRAIAFGVALLISGTSATVSLSSFTPRINNIGNTQCESAYNTLIKGCQASDFGGDVVCSAACIRGLQEITQLVQRSCSGVRVDQSSIIGVFQSGIGIKSLRRIEFHNRSEDYNSGAEHTSCDFKGIDIGYSRALLIFGHNFLYIGYTVFSGAVVNILIDRPGCGPKPNFGRWFVTDG